MASRFNPHLVQTALHPLTEDYFLREGKLWRRIDMHGRGSDIDEPVTDLSEREHNLIVIALHLEAQVRPLCPQTGGSHRMRKVPAHRACVDCGLKE